MSQAHTSEDHARPSVPHHVAIVMDGNGRWAKKRFLPRIAGHQQGVEALRRITHSCLKRGISVLTVFAFSSENWKRPDEEVSGLLNLFALALSREVKNLHEKGVRIHFIGRKNRLSSSILEALNKAQNETKYNKNLILNVCFDYGGKWDICQAIEKINNSSGISNKYISEEDINKHLSLSHVPDPDLIVRTGGEMRMSNFLLWQMAYSELFFTPILWPDADEALINEAIDFYCTRERRFGKTSDQVKQ